ncbi:hypothetical protein K4K54_009517 [Colletotrichum sp. SAR 10_86]|nr:hypothetical protein KHU50_005147 [Colletotrichum sp. SAR 10_65]KAI8233934.1 hypothetical protein K4K54_009517 [Colletotrichum sp. SAR 10_86]
MAEAAAALAAFALAGNVLQFLEFGKTLVDRGLSIHRAGGNAPEDLQDLRDAIASLQAAANQLKVPQSERVQSADQQALILEKMDDLRSDISHSRSQMPSNGDSETSWDAPGDAMLDFVVHDINTKPQERSERKNRLRNDIILLIRKKSLEKGEQTFSLSESRKKALQEEFFASISYAGMDNRRTRIVHAHKKTLRWIFDAPPETTRKWSDFKEWLGSDSQLYWVTGKAGSGKSTLMKFISQSQGLEEDGVRQDDTLKLATTETQNSQYLLKWAGSRPLIMASFYFWASGTSIEASPRGLYMSLLYQILPLRGMIIQTIKEAQKVYKICLFVDGLDEFSGPPEHLIVLFQDVLSHSNHGPSLKLEDLTYEDIKAYITEEFQSNPGFSRLLDREPRAVLGTLDPFYFEHAAQYFKLLGACKAPPSALLFAFADEDNNKFAVDLPIEKLTDEAILSRIETIRRRVNSRCKGLIEVDSSGFGFEAEQTVQYLHRSVKDYVESPELMFSNERLEDFFTMIKGTETLSPWLEHHYGTHFMSLMVQKDVLVYVQEKAPLNSLVRRTESQSVSQFRTGVRPWVKRFFSKVTKQVPENVVLKDSHLWWPLLLDAYFSRPPKQAMVEYLLNNGANVNFQFKDAGTTVWTELLTVTIVTCLVEACTDREVEERWAESVPIIRLFINHGATINKKAFDLALMGMNRVRLDGFNTKLVYQAFESLKTDGEEVGLAFLRQAANNV